jgi:serpin B
MSQDGKYHYLKTDDFQAVALPYGQGRFSMYVFLPNEAAGLNALIASLTGPNWERWSGQFHIEPGHVSLPRFKIDYEAELKQALEALGIDRAFDPGSAEFPNMTFQPPKAVLSAVKHKSFLEVHELGTEAAAVTSAEVSMTAVSAKRPFLFVADHPFFLAIVDGQTHMILFMGAITDPR